MGLSIDGLKGALSSVGSSLKSGAQSIGNTVSGTIVPTVTAAKDYFQPAVQAVGEEIGSSVKGLTALGKYGLSYGAAAPFMSKQTRQNLRKDFQGLSTEDKIWAVADAASLIPVGGTLVKGASTAAKVGIKGARMAKAGRAIEKGAQLKKLQATRNAAQDIYKKEKAAALYKNARKDYVKGQLESVSRFFKGDTPEQYQQLRKTYNQMTHLKEAKKATAAKYAARRDSPTVIDKVLSKERKTRSELQKAIRDKVKTDLDAQHLKAQALKNLGPYSTLQWIKNQAKKS